MKKIITLFAFTFCLHLSLFALSISSEKTDTFMRLPEWMPASVDSEHTFGSDEHANCTHRTTTNTLAAAESVFDAYYERLFFFGEGRSNDWNITRYGPVVRPKLRPEERDKYIFNEVFFINTNAVDRQAQTFDYASSDTNGVLRVVPDTRRIVDIGNILSLAKYGFLGSKIFDYGQWENKVLYDSYHRNDCPWLARTPTWQEAVYSYRDPAEIVDSKPRPIYIGSSWMPGVSHPEDFCFRTNMPPWRDEWMITNMCLPVYECKYDGVFNCEVPNRWDLSYRTLGYHNERDYAQENVLHFRWLSAIDFGEMSYVDHLTGHMTGYIEDLSSYRDRTIDSEKHSWIDETVPGLIKKKFPLAVPEEAFTNLTRRLVPDDYVKPKSVDIRESNIGSTTESNVMYDKNQPVGGGPNDYVEFDTLEFYTEYVPFEIYEELKLSGVGDPSGNKVTAVCDGINFGPHPKGTDKIRLSLVDGPIGWWEDDWPNVGDHEWIWYKREATFRIEYIHIDIRTNDECAASSVIATESRVLSMLDRTYEILDPPHRRYTVMSNRVSEAKGRLHASGSANIGEAISRATESSYWFPQSDPFKIRLSNVQDFPERISVDLQPDAKGPQTSVTNWTENILSLDRDFVRSSGLETRIESVSAESNATARIQLYTVRDLKDDLGYEFTLPGHETTFRIKFSFGTHGEFGNPFGNLYFDLYIPELSLYRTLSAEYAVSNLLYAVDISMTRDARVEFSSPDTRYAIDRNYPWFGPGKLASETGRVGDGSVISLLVGIYSRERVNPFYPMPSPYEYLAFDPYAKVYTDSFLQENLNCCRSTSIAPDIDKRPDVKVIDAIYEAIGSSGWAREKLHGKTKIMKDGEINRDIIAPNLNMLDTTSFAITGASFEFGDDSPRVFEVDVERIGQDGSTGRVIGVYEVLAGGRRDLLADEQQISPFDMSTATPGLKISFAVLSPTPKPDADVQPVAADMLVSPLISTEWNWKALKSYENQ